MIAEPVEKTKVECCPICGLEARKCSFMMRMYKAKFASDPAESARLRAAAFRTYHADFCPTCRQPRQACREKRITRILAWAKKNVVNGYLDDVELAKVAADTAICPCKKPVVKRDVELVKPKWWTESPVDAAEENG